MRKHVHSFLKDMSHPRDDYGQSFWEYSVPIIETVISVDAGNRYGHPENEMLAHLNGICCGNIKRTDWDGEVVEKLFD